MARNEIGESLKANAKMWKIVGDEYTFAQWQALGYDTHSILITTESEMKALFTDYDNHIYTLKTGSSAIGTGKNLGVICDDGLDASNIFGGTPITKQQPTSWDCGAYIH